MASLGDDSYLITGKVCPPKLPMQNIPVGGWNNLTPSLLESLFTKTIAQGKQTSSLNSLCALSFQASVWLSTDGLSSSSVVGLPYFFCNFCNYHTDGRAQLLRHIASKHVFQCKLCDFISVTRYELVQHQLHKHLDAEEMQPVLNSKMVHLNLSLLQRSLHSLTQQYGNFNNSTLTSIRRDESEQVNSSQMKTPRILRDGQQDVIIQELNDRSKCHQVRIKDTSSVTSSKCTITNSCVNFSITGESSSEPDWQTLTDTNETGNITKRSCSDVECELSPKRFKNSSDVQFHDAYVPSHRSSSHMPHFLDESDSNVTSSCSPYKNISPVLFEGRQTEQMSSKKTQNRSLESNPTGRVLSFLMEPTGFSASVESAKSVTNYSDNSTSKVDTLHKILHWCNDQNESDICKESKLVSPKVSQRLPVYSKFGPCTSFDASGEVNVCGQQKSQNPDLALLSKEKLQPQLEKPLSKGSGGSFVDSFRDMLEVTELSSGKLLSRGSLSKNSELTINLASNVLVEDDTRSGNWERKQSEPQLANSQEVDNFLVVPKNIADAFEMKRREGNSRIIQKENSCKNNVKRSTETHSSGYEGEKYDLLRKLLVGTASTSKQTDTVSASATKTYEKRSKSLVSKNCSHIDFFPANKEKCELKDHASTVIRASDMSLKDLLTQGLGNIPSLIFCSYCNFKLSSKAELQNHIEKCKHRQSSEKSEAQIHNYSLSCQIKSEPECANDKISIGNNVPTSVLGSLLDGLYSKRFMASEVLKGLSEHYSESVSSDVSFTSESEIQSSQTPSLLNSQAHGLDKIVSTLHEYTDVNGKHLRYRRSIRKKPEFDYNCELSNSSSSCNSDSDDKTCPVTNVMKKNNEKNKHGFAQNKYGSNGAAVSQKYGSHEESSQKHDSNEIAVPPKYCSNGATLPELFDREIHQSCLYCDFSTCHIADMRHHLIGNHLKCTPFAEALVQPKGKTLFYFCRHVQSGCTFVSGEGVEIFEHIKLCYCGYLDNFINDDNETAPHYSQVLLSLGEASKLIDQSVVLFHCLRCRYSRSDFQKVANHVSENHAQSVAGVLSINKVFKGPKVGMACLTCNAHISAKQWASHSCRKRSVEISYSKGTVTDLSSMAASTSKLETHLRLSGIPNCQPVGAEGEEVLDSYISDADVKKNDLEEDCKPEMLRLNHRSDVPELNQASNNKTNSHILSKSLDENLSEFFNIKQEVLDVELMDREFLDDVPVQFSYSGQADPGKACRLHFNDCETESTRLDQPGRTIISPQDCSRRICSGSSVLQSLLTAPQDAELTPRGFSMLHNLLKPNNTAKETGLSKQLSALPAETSFGPMNTHSQYPCILEMLSRQGCSAQEALYADSISVPPNSDTLQKDKGEGSLTNFFGSELVNASCSLASSQQSQHVDVTKYLPNMSVSQISKPSSVSVCELSPPLIPHPPVLPLLPPLSPSPPLSNSTSLMSTESQETPGPFTNLLRLLSKSKLKSGSAQNATF